jgi:precorrin-2/cobalt-factor-2 C20-methyltransferase
MKKIVGIGIGPGDKELLTLKAYRIIRECDYVFLPESKGESLAKQICWDYIEDKQIIELSFPMGEENAGRYVEAAKHMESILGENETGVFLTLGDPMIYSTYGYLRLQLDKLGIQNETIPGITSYQAAAAMLGTAIVSRDESFYLADGDVDSQVLEKVNAVSILKVSKNKQKIMEKLEQAGFRYVYVKRCTQESQAILVDKEEILKDQDYMSLIFARRS